MCFLKFNEYVRGFLIKVNKKEKANNVCKEVYGLAANLPKGACMRKRHIRCSYMPTHLDIEPGTNP